MSTSASATIVVTATGQFKYWGARTSPKFVVLAADPANSVIETEPPIPVHLYRWADNTWVLKD